MCAVAVAAGHATAVGNPFLAPKRRPIVVGHRGVPVLHQENTLAGFRRAIALGIPAVELDVRLTADRRAVVLHDNHLERLTGLNRTIGQLTWDAVSRLRIRRALPMGRDVYGGPAVVRYEHEERIPLLAEVLAEIAPKLAINVELKLDGPWWQANLGAIVAHEIEAAGAEDRVIVTSFDPRKLRAALRRRDALAVGFCFDDTMLDLLGPLLDRLPRIPVGLDTQRNARRALNWLLDGNFAGKYLGSRVVGAEHTLVGPDTVHRLHQAGVAIGTHTLFPIGSPGKPIARSATTVAEVERLVALGVDWIESDDPERLLSIVG
ncbi:MAG: glycerophosphodiester phosphodiesterase [Kofleriaceae bacterium]